MTSFESHDDSNPAIFPTNNESDQDKVVEELEMKISKLKNEHSTFVAYVDDLNDIAYEREIENKQLKADLKLLDKQLAEMTKERSHLKKTFDKLNPHLKDKDLPIHDINVENLAKASNSDLNSDIVDYLKKKGK